MKINYSDLIHRNRFLFLLSSFELSDVAFCILSRYNQTFFHLSRQHSCSCSNHYLNLNLNSMILGKYPSNYLRLTPLCRTNQSNSTMDEDEEQLIVRGLDNQCDYRLVFLDCDAMTTTTTATVQAQTEFSFELLDTSIHLTTSTLISLLPSK